MTTTSLPVLTGNNIDPIVSPIIGRVFTVNSSTVGGDKEVMLTSVDIYIRSKPNSVSNGSGVVNPGINATILPTKNHIPVTSSSNILAACNARLEYTELVPSIDASVASTFVFPTPISVSTDTEYALIIGPDNNELFEYWLSSTGEVVIGTNLVSTGSSAVPGYFYQNIAGTWSVINKTDLKFQIRCARYAVNGVAVNAASTVITLPINDYEYITYTDPNHFVYGGENVFQVNASPTLTGTVVYGNSLFTTTANVYTMFTGGSDPEYLIAKDANIYNVRKVVSINSNNTIVVDEPFTFSNAACLWYKSPVGVVYYNNYIQQSGSLTKLMILKNSNANGSVKFSNNSTLACELSGCIISNAHFGNLPVSIVEPNIYINIPAGTSVSETETFNYTSVDGANVSNAAVAFIQNVTQGSDFYTPYGSNVALPSRSNEMGLLPSTTSSLTPSNSSVISIQATTTDFSAPSVHVTGTDVFFYNYDINNDYSAENTNNGNASSKAVTNQFQLNTGSFAEDVVVYMDLYRPPGTDVKVFAKLYNSVSDPDSFTQKDWTLLNITNGANLYSNPTTTNGYVELTYGLPLYPNSAFVSSGYSTVPLNSNIITGSNTSYNTQFAVGNMVKLYQPLFANDYMISVVTAVTNATSMTIADNVSNSGIAAQSLYIDKIAYPYQAFNNNENTNIVRYYTSNNAIVDNYDTWAVKIVFLSNSVFNVPAVKDIRFIAVST
ncbi:MAG: hypothetical protein P4L79_09830 [Legionella sp.]|uniref:hypothetical protein n=1 Tax=Legionella sp. TaxID=459 RepID=UPI002850CD79|nr:hypothetical protein [Legionella sp.]